VSPDVSGFDVSAEPTPIRYRIVRFDAASRLVQSRSNFGSWRFADAVGGRSYRMVVVQEAAGNGDRGPARRRRASANRMGEPRPADYVTIPGLLRTGRTSADIFDLMGRLVLANALSVAE
jgi:hypothetical protein